MPWLLDTNHWIVLLKGRCQPLQEKLRQHLPRHALGRTGDFFDEQSSS